MLKLSIHSTLLCLAGLLLCLSSCKEDDDTVTPTVEDKYEIPTKYSTFDNVSYSGQTQRLSMFLELKSYMSAANTPNTSLDATRLKAMYANDATTAQWTGTYEASKQLKSKTFSTEQEKFEVLFDKIAVASQSTVPGTTNQAGVINSNDGQKQYLIAANGLDYAQIIEKSLMGACLYYQATGVYMESGKMDVDNETITPGEGTDMEHHWDEAFGYLGVSQDFPTNKDGLIFWGSYSDKRNDLLGSNQKLMDGFLKGRAAITNKDLITRDEAIDELRPAWELVSVGSALHYLNVGINSFDDIAIRNHGLSEGIGFIYSLKFNPAKNITVTQIDELLVLIAGASNFDDMNLYTVDTTKLEEARDQLAAYFNLTDKKEDF